MTIWIVQTMDLNECDIPLKLNEFCDKLKKNGSQRFLDFADGLLKIQRSPKKSFRHHFLRSFDQTALTLW